MSDAVTYMHQAIELAYQGMAGGHGGPFGAVIVRDGEVIGRGHNRVLSATDPTAHAEVTAIRDAAANIKNFDLSGSEIFVNGLPCPMCMSAIFWARIGKVHYGCPPADAAAIGFDDHEFYRQLALPPEQRLVPAVQVTECYPQARACYQAWADNDARIPLLNEPTREAFVKRYGHVFEHSAWVARRAWAWRPFAHEAALHVAMMKVVVQAGPAMQRALIAAHPELGAQVALTAESEAEQAGAGLRRLSATEFARFTALNAAYRQKFGLPFVICVRHHDKAAIFAAFERRLENDAATEHAAALHEISEITWLRLAEMELKVPA